jgi:1-acyl-sn-glycerol-3-phosphate acyltransferase
MRFLRSAAVWLGIVLATILFGVPAIAAAFVPPRGDWFLLFARGWARTILAFSGVRVTVRHAERFPRESVVLASNHESYADVLVILANVPMQVRFLAKRSIFRIPILGWSIRAAGFVPVDRGDSTRGAAAVETALQRLTSGRSLVVFPEQTRSRTGELGVFKKGAALLALKAQRPLLPIGIAGTRGVLPRGGWNMSPGPVALVIGEPLEVAGKSVKDRDGVMRLLRERVGELKEEAGKQVSRESET